MGQQMLVLAAKVEELGEYTNQSGKQSLHSLVEEMEALVLEVCCSGAPQVGVSLPLVVAELDC